MFGVSKIRPVLDSGSTRKPSPHPHTLTLTPHLTPHLGQVFNGVAHLRNMFWPSARPVVYTGVYIYIYIDLTLKKDAHPEGYKCAHLGDDLGLCFGLSFALMSLPMLTF